MNQPIDDNHKSRMQEKSPEQSGLEHLLMLGWKRKDGTVISNNAFPPDAIQNIQETMIAFDVHNLTLTTGTADTKGNRHLEMKFSELEAACASCNISPELLNKHIAASTTVKRR